VRASCPRGPSRSRGGRSPSGGKKLPRSRRLAGASICWPVSTPRPCPCLVLLPRVAVVRARRPSPEACATRGITPHAPRRPLADARATRGFSPAPCLAHESHVPHVAAKPRAPPAARRTCHAWQAPRAPPCPAHMCHTWHAGRAPPATPWLMCHAWHSRPARCMPSARAAPGRRPSRTSGTRTTRSTRTPSSTGGRPCSSAWSLSTTRDSSTRRMRCTTPASRPARPRSGAGVPLPLCHMHRHIFHTQRL